MITIMMIRTRLLLPAAALLALAGVGLASGGGDGPGCGQPIRRARRFADGGRTAVLLIGSYFQPGSHEVRVPASQLSVADGQVTLRPEIAEALNVLPQR